MNATNDFEIISYSDQTNRKRHGYLVRRISDGKLYMFGFKAKPSPWVVNELKLSERFWVASPQLVLFDLHNTLAESLRAE